jgi:hypothetical protein
MTAFSWDEVGNGNPGSRIAVRLMHAEKVWGHDAVKSVVIHILQQSFQRRMH